MTNAHWFMLWGALACGFFLFAAPATALRDLLPGNPDLIMFIAAIGAIGLQTLGARSMRTYLRDRGQRAPITLAAAFTAALLWGVAVLAAIWGTGSGPGGVTIGILLVLPAGALAFMTQLVTLAAFVIATRQNG